jgi:hypothetical protein
LAPTDQHADFADVDFIALDGLHALFALNIQCARTGATWALIHRPCGEPPPSRVADHDKLLPAVGSATEALLLIRRSSGVAADGHVHRSPGIHLVGDRDRRAHRDYRVGVAFQTPNPRSPMGFGDDGSGHPL